MTFYKNKKYIPFPIHMISKFHTKVGSILLKLMFSRSLLTSAIEAFVIIILVYLLSLEGKGSLIGLLYRFFINNTLITHFVATCVAQSNMSQPSELLKYCL